jgi:hypothetical protein
MSETSHLKYLFLHLQEQTLFPKQHELLIQLQWISKEGELWRRQS